MGGKQLGYSDMPKMPGLTSAQESDRRRSFRRIERRLKGSDMPLFSLAMESLEQSETAYRRLMGKVLGQSRQDKGKGKDRERSMELAGYLRDALANLREPVLRMNSANLADIYEEFVKGVAGIIDEGYLERPFSQNAERFLQVEPHLTTCCAICNVSPLGEELRGVLASSFASAVNQVQEPADGPVIQEKGKVIPFPRGKEFKPGMGREIMAKEKPKPEGSLFESVSTPEGGGWFAVMMLEDDLSKPVTKEDKAGINKAKNLVTGSDLPEEKKREFLDYLKKAEKGDMFAVTQAEAVVYWYFQGEIPDKQFEFEVRLMDAWLGGKIDSFLEKERKALNKKIMPAEEKTALNEMFDLVFTRSDVLKAVAAGNLGFYHPLAKPEERLKKISNMVFILSSAKPVAEQAP